MSRENLRLTGTQDGRKCSGMTILALSLGDYLKSHPIILSLVFAGVMILSDRQDAENIREGDAWWRHLGLLLLAAFTLGAIVNRLWPSAVIGLVALYVGARLLRRRVEVTPNAGSKS